METTIYLIRHAQTECNASGRFQGWADIELNDCGLDQARRLAFRLIRTHVDAIFTSPLKRASVTAGGIARDRGITPVALSDLREMNYGEWEGLSREEVAAKWPELLVKMRTDPTGVEIPGGETFKELRERAARAFRSIVEKQEGRTVAIISHQGVLKAIVANILGAPNSIWGKFEIGNASITTVKIDGNVPRLITLNDVSYLESSEKTIAPALKVAVS